jgi:6-phosphofructokinase 2
MKKIITLTLNPAIDKSTIVESLIPEKKLKCSQPKFEPGGGGINVSRAIQRMGGESTAVYLSGGYSGIYFNELLEAEKINIKPVTCKELTRENLIVFEQSSGKQYRFGMPGPTIAKEEWEQVLNIINDAADVEFLVASGSIPNGVAPDIFSQLSQIAQQKNIKFIADTSGEALQNALQEGLFLIKPNLNELSSLSGKRELSIEEVPLVAKKIIESGKCKFMVVSLGAAGAMLVTSDECVHMMPPKVKSISTVGAGDSMVAGITFNLSKGKNIHDAVKYGIACGTAATLNPGTELCHKKDADEIFKNIIEKKII